MQAIIERPKLKKLFTNKFFTYITRNNPLRGELVEVEMNVTGKRISYTYRKVRERN